MKLRGIDENVSETSIVEDSECNHIVGLQNTLSISITWISTYLSVFDNKTS